MNNGNAPTTILSRRLGRKTAQITFRVRYNSCSLLACIWPYATSNKTMLRIALARAL